jgi:hypothetical protein
MCIWKKSAVLGLCLWALTTTAQAQLLPGGGTIPVIDTANLLVNQGTQGNTGAIAGAAGILVQQGERNLVPSGVYPAHDLAQLINLINEVLPYREALHYLMPNLGEVFGNRYGRFGLTPRDWWDLVSIFSTTGLDTLQGTLQTVHEQLKPLEWGLDTALLAVLKGSIANPAQGNLSITQIQSMATAHLIEELRKSRQMMGANINANNIAQAHHINMEMYSQRLLHDTLEASVFPVTVYTGANGYRRFGG